MATIDEELRRAVLAWRDDDPDESTRRELDELLEKGDEDELRDRFSQELEFGTAGLRGLLGAGPNRMNRRVALRATAGVVAWVKKNVPDAAARGVAIGYDGRRLSREIALDVAEVVCGAGFRAYVFDHVVPTPVLAFTAIDRHTAAAVMVTASHNPPQYNGYKVYWENGAQIIPPHDEGIAGEIARIESVARLPRVSRDDAMKKGLLVVLGDDLERRYLDAVRALAVHPETPRDLRIAYTALHGVGERFARAALAEAGFTSVYSVKEQAEPDGRFPTVDFPNPEEKGAMDLVLALAKKEGADLVLANDPDADRLAVAVRDHDGRYVTLTGNEVGCLLAHYLLSSGSGGGRFVLSSIVSSPWLADIAHAHGAHFEHTLTGFKWIANEAMRIEKERGLTFVMGYEEALGYTVGTLVRDKDGVSAAALVADMAAWCKSRGKTLLDEREIAWRKYGMFLSGQVAVVLPGAEGKARIEAVMRGLREEPPASLAGLDVLAVTDLERGTRTAKGGAATELAYAPTPLVILETEGGHRIMARPSGTEPKIKLYFDVRVEIAEGEPIAAARARGEKTLASVTDAFQSYVGV
jgi:phosphomannomutase